MGYTSVFYAPVAQQPAHHFGGTLTNLLGRQACFRLIAFSLIAEIRALKIA
jgi:hypothetical protein